MPPFLLLLAACPGTASVVEDVTDPRLRDTRAVVPAVDDVHPWNLAGVRPGDWARYREPGRTVTIAAVGRDGEHLWIEVIDEGEPRLASARLVTMDGDVLKARFRELPDGPVVDQELRQWAPPPGSRRTRSSRRKDQETLEVGGRTLETVRFTDRYEDLEGRLSEETSWWHPDVPRVYASDGDGGLVRRVTPKGTVELQDYGRDAKPRVR